jgi:protein-S-isoprenylcysteine O-methyltransferase Ste14
MPESTPHPDGAAVRFPPPFVPVIALALGLAAQVLVPWSVPLPTPIRIGLGVVLLVVSSGLMAAAFGLFRRTGQDPKPWVESPELIASGVYRFTRNPMYLSMGLIQAGLGVLLSNAWIVVLVPATWITIHWIAIRHEEAYLAEKFGAAYLDYKARVRRWL